MAESPSPAAGNALLLANHHNEGAIRKFRTITMLLDAFSIQAPPHWIGNPHPTTSTTASCSRKAHKPKPKARRHVSERSALEALALLLVRNHEIVAVASSGYDTEGLQIVASVEAGLSYVALANPRFRSVPEEWHVHYPSSTLGQSREGILTELMVSMTQNCRKKDNTL